MWERTVVSASLNGLVDTARSQEVYREWLALARPAPGPGGLRRPMWLLRPYKPDPAAYRFPGA
jgi:hypothetical protein